MTPKAFRSLSPRELALMVRGHRRRQNYVLRVKAWETFWRVAAHLSKDSTLTPRDLLMQAPGFDPDEEDLIDG